MSTEDDRPRHSADSGLFTPGSDTYQTSRYDTPSSTDAPYFDENALSSADTTVLPDSAAYEAFSDEPSRKPGPTWHTGADLGLLALRVVLGFLFISHGLQKLFGWFQGGGIDGTRTFLEGFGFTSSTTTLAWVTGVTELVGGTLIALGLFTPAGAAAILGLMGSAIWVKFNGNDFAGRVELEAIYAAAAFALLFAGPGRVSLDRPTPWYRYASAFGVVFLVIAAGAMITMLTVFR
jgi:putative oxidoreductase